MFTKNIIYIPLDDHSTAYYTIIYLIKYIFKVYYPVERAFLWVIIPLHNTINYLLNMLYLFNFIFHFKYIIISVIPGGMIM